MEVFRTMDAERGIFEAFFQRCEIGHFFTVWLIVGKKTDRIFMKILS